MKLESPYIKDETILRTLDYTEEYCLTCDRIMQFDIQTNECVLCGSNSPFGLWDDRTDQEWEEYYDKYKQTVPYCLLKRK